MKRFSFPPRLLCNLLTMSVLLGIALAAVLALSAVVPFHMDEFVQYHALSCVYYPLNALNTFREGCGVHDLVLWGNTTLPLRSFQYVGSIPGLVYWPLFLLWPSPLSARFLGVLMLGIQAWCLRRLTGVHVLAAFVCLLAFMPYAFVHMVDTGPVIYHTTTVMLLAWLARRWRESLRCPDRQGGVAVPLAIGILLFIGLWAKLAFMFLLPALLVLIAGNALWPKSDNQSLSWRRLVLDVVLVSVSAGGAGAILLLARNRWGTPYYTIITSAEKTRPWEWGVAVEHFRSYLAGYFVNPLRAAGTVFNVSGPEVTWQGVLLWATVALFFIWGAVALVRRRRLAEGRFALLNVGLFVLTLFVLSLSEETKAMHHVVLAFPFLVLAAFDLYSRLDKDRWRAVLLAVFVIVNISLYAELPHLTYKPNHPPGFERLNHEVNERFGTSHVFVIITWGLYYPKALYGVKQQSVLYIDPLFTPEQIVGIRDILRRTGRKLVVIGHQESLPSLYILKKAFPRLQRYPVPYDIGDWGVWYVE